MDPIGLRPSRRPALVTGAGDVVTHRDLVALMDAVSPHLPAGRRSLVALVGDRELGTVAAYLAALRDGHTAAWLGAARDPAQRHALVAAYEPEILAGPADLVRSAAACAGYDRVVGLDRPGFEDFALAQRRGPASDIHPGTRLLLVTSGSVSGGRGVRLSAEAVAANTAAVCASLSIDENTRGATSLPLYYTYGLSVLHAHLAAGSSLLLTAEPPTGQRFWRAFADAGCEIFNGVPVNFEWLDRLPWRRVASLKTMTVAGGRLRTPLAERLHQECDASGRRFYKMYGQTEATARISVLDHEDFGEHPDSVGRPLPVGQVSIRPGGEIVYTGRCVMQGYADGRADLARPDETLGTLDTGDLGFVRDGFLYVTGRAARFVKVDGRRISLDAVEDRFAVLAPSAAVEGENERAIVFVESAPTAELERTRQELVARLGLPPYAVRLRFVDRIPRRANGKIDYRGLAAVDESAP